MDLDNIVNTQEHAKIVSRGNFYVMQQYQHCTQHSTVSAKELQTSQVLNLTKWQR